MKEQLAALKEEAQQAIAACTDEAGLYPIKVTYLGKKGSVTKLGKKMGSLSPEERKEAGMAINEVKKALETALAERAVAIENERYLALADTEWLDVTRPGTTRRQGHLHPLSRIQYELEDIFTSMGFIVLDGPEVETDFFNFEALNIPKDHPARDMQDTFWTEDGNLLRTQTSPVQIRGMKSLTPPFRVIAPGRVFRYEDVDASHEHTFHQMEGLMVGEDISTAHLVYFLRVALSTIFKQEIEVRLRPGYFPFVEPGYELDFRCLICGGEGCPVCKHTGWIEFLGCGLVHPNVLQAGGVDPETYSGFAFGMGLERLAMMRYGINDIRHFQSGDLRFVRQFVGGEQ